jgi:hypothetical protein
MAMRIWAASVAAVAAFSLVPCIVGSKVFGAAQPSADAHVQRGLELRKKGRDADALAEFEEAMKISPSPRAKSQVGLAQMAIGLFEAAEATLSEVLSSSGDDSWVSAHRATLSDALTKIRSHLGTLNVNGDPKGAAVEVNGTTAGTLPCSLHVQAGDVVVRVRAPGYLPITRTVSVEPGTISNQIFTLVSAADNVSDRVSSAKPPEETAGDKAPHTEPVTEPSPDASPSGSSPTTSNASPWPWIAAGGSLLALSFGAVEAVRWESKASDFDNMKGAGNTQLCVANASNAGGGSCANLLSEGHTARDLAIGGFAIGAALGITSAILFSRSAQGDQRQAFSCVPALGRPGIECAMLF